MAGAIASPSPGQIRRSVRLQRNRLRGCYEQALLGDPELTGRLQVTFVIAPDGRVARAAVSASTVNSPALETCVLETVSSIVFWPSPDYGIRVVHYPLVFRRAPPGARAGARTTRLLPTTGPARPGVTR